MILMIEIILIQKIRSRESVSSDERLQNAKSPKQLIEKWLREHASEFGLTGADGNPVAAAIEQISKVANWKTERGGRQNTYPTSG